MHHACRNVSNGICDFRRALLKSFNGEGDRVGDEELGEATVSMLDRGLLLSLFSLATCAAITLRRVNELPTPLVARLNHAEGGAGAFDGTMYLATDVPSLLLREPVGPRRRRTLMSTDSSENLDTKLSALEEGRRSI